MIGDPPGSPETPPSGPARPDERADDPHSLRSVWVAEPTLRLLQAEARRSGRSFAVIILDALERRGAEVARVTRPQRRQTTFTMTDEAVARLDRAAADANLRRGEYLDRLLPLALPDTNLGSGQDFPVIG